MRRLASRVLRFLWREKLALALGALMALGVTVAMLSGAELATVMLAGLLAAVVLLMSVQSRRDGRRLAGNLDSFRRTVAKSGATSSTKDPTPPPQAPLFRRVLAAIETERLEAAERHRTALAALEAHTRAVGGVRDGLSRLRGAANENHRWLLEQVQQARFDAAEDGTGRPADQLATAMAAITTAPSVLLIHVGTESGEFCNRLGRPSQMTRRELSASTPISAEKMTEIDTLVVVASSLADLARIVPSAEQLPKARRLVVVVIRSSPAYGLPAVGLPLNGVTADVRLRTGRSHGWTLDVAFPRARRVHNVLRSVARPSGVRLTPIGHSADRHDLPVARPDFRLVNPVGFAPESRIGLASLEYANRQAFVTDDRNVILAMPIDAPLTEAGVAALRPFRGLMIDPKSWVTADDTQEPAQRLADTVLPALAMAGVPLCATELPVSVLGRADSRLLKRITSITPEELDDELRREEHSIRLRRLGLRAAGCAAHVPPVSVLLCTRRPDLIDFALGQVRGQRDTPLEVIIGLHGDWADSQAVRERAKTSLDNCEVLDIPADVTFPDALNRLAAAASGSILVKMDDDDWYAPDFLSDLLLARSYSQADVVGCGVEFAYLEGRNTTIRRRRPSEVFDQFSSGASLMFDRALLDAVGGFRLGEPVGGRGGGEDSEFQAAVMAAGGTLYRSHALNLVVRRRAEGHTWQVDEQFFLRHAKQTWPGLRLTPLFDGPLEPSSEAGTAVDRPEVDGQPRHDAHDPRTDASTAPRRAAR